MIPAEGGSGICIQNRNAECFQNGDVVHYHIPGNGMVDGTISMCNNIPHQLNITPGYFRMCGSKSITKGSS